MYNKLSVLADKCEACGVKNCEKCDGDKGNCTKCDQGYNPGANGTTCVVDANKTLAPCGPGYYKDQADFKCKACKGGCKRCSTDKNCF